MAAGYQAAGDYEDEDLVTLTHILESEIQSHQRKRAVCFAMFCVSLVSLTLALVLGGVQLVVELFPSQSSLDLERVSGGISVLQLLTPLAAFAMTFFGAWWSCQNCVNSIERTLFAARARRHKLFKTFVEQISCADQKKKRVWLDLVKGFF